jgi:hypothetical protein
LLEVKRGRCVGLKASPPSVSRISRQCGILNISQPYRHPWLVKGIALLFICRRYPYLTGNTHLHCLLRGYLYFLYVDGVHTSQETQTSTASYTCSYMETMFVPHRRHRPPQLAIVVHIWRRCSYLTGDTDLHSLLYLFIYGDDVRTSQETQTSTASFTCSYMETMFVPHRRHRPPQLALPVYICRRCLYLTGDIDLHS